MMKVLTVFILWNVNVLLGKEITNPIDKVVENGYSLEIHSVVTKDGYILELHRILGEKDPILILHGLPGSSDNFIVNGPGEALAYNLNDEGYDVWLGNKRGNRYSRKHTSISPENKHFWNFTIHDIGVNDVSAMIDYILMETKKSSLAYVGHSQGTNDLLILLSEFPEYNDVIKIAFLLGPSIFMKNSKSFRLLSPLGIPQPNADKRYSYEFASPYKDCPRQQAFCHTAVDILTRIDTPFLNKVSNGKFIYNFLIIDKWDFDDPS